MEAGPTSPTSMGAVPLTWDEMGAWERRFGIELSPWESRLLRRLSYEYLKESHRAEKHDAAPPWADEGALKKHAAKTMREQMRNLGNL